MAVAIVGEGVGVEEGVAVGVGVRAGVWMGVGDAVGVGVLVGDNSAPQPTALQAFILPYVQYVPVPVILSAVASI